MAGYTKAHVTASRNRLADHMADGGTFAEYARLTKLDRRGIQRTWKRICEDLGWQAN